MLPFGKYAALTAALAIAACTSSGGGPGGLSASQIRALPVTANMPTSGTAIYRGKTSQTEYDPDVGNLTITSDVQLDANFASNRIDGTISNVKGSTAVGSATLRGDLNGTGDIVGSQFYVPVGGFLSSNSNSTYVTADIDGTFKGSNAEAIQGSVTFEDAATTPLIAVKQ